MRRCWPIWILICALPSVAFAQGDPVEERRRDPVSAPAAADDAPAPSSARLLLDAIREDLVALRFEEALAAVDALLGDANLSEPDRAEGMVLRLQTHVAFGDLKASERDYREILRLRPGYIPDSTLTPSKAMQRFERIRAETIGRLTIRVDPPDARVLIDDREAGPGFADGVPILAGEHVVRAERDGFDPEERIVLVEAGVDGVVELALVPNARTVVVLTEPDGVEVRVDGVLMGVTERSGGSASLRLGSLGLGEHLFELTKECHRPTRRREFVTVDLNDRSPMQIGVIRLDRVTSRLVLTGANADTELWVDGERRVGGPPDPIDLCPGLHELQVRRGSRRLWQSTATLVEGREHVVEVVARPNLTRVGMELWPPELAPMEGRFNETRVDRPRDADLDDPAGWRRVELAADTDLAIARTTGGFRLYSPILRRVVKLSGAIELLDPPAWDGPVWGLVLVDSELGGAAMVADVSVAAGASGPSPGDRLLTVGGRRVSSAEQARSILAVASTRAPLEVAWESPDGRTGQAAIRGRRSPRLIAAGAAETDVDTVLRAAWATAQAAADPESAMSPLMNLAILLSRHGLHEQAVETLRRIDWKSRAGIGDGTVQYYLGRELGRLGRESESVAALRRAAASESTVVDDEGAAVAPAARDRLADLGVKP